MKRRLTVAPRLGLCAVLLAAWLLGACTKQSPEQLVAAAERHLSEHNYRAAQIELRNAIQAAPENGPAYRLLGVAMLRGGDPVGAESALRKALSLSEKADAVVPTLALALLRQGQAKQLVDEFGNTSLQDPGANADLRASIGHAWLARGDAKQAGDAFAAVLAVRPEQASALLGQATIAGQGGAIDDALALVDRALKADPRLEEGHMFKGQMLLAKGQRAPAIESFERALAIDPAYLPARLALVSVLIEAREYDKAKAVLAVAGASPKSPGLNFLHGLLAVRQGDLPKAKDSLAAVLKESPDHASSLLLAGEVELRLGNLGLAEQHLGKAVKTQPTPAAQRLLAATYLRQNRPGKALDTLQPQLQEPGPKDAGLMMLAGEAYLANGDVRRAVEYFEASKTAGPTEAAARTRLGQIAATRGEFDRGAEELQAASALMPDKVEPDAMLVALHMRRQEFAKALAAAQALIKKQPQNPMGYVLAAAVQTAQRDRAGARQSYEAALKLNPDHVPALRGLTELDLAEGRTADVVKRYEGLLAKNPDDDQVLIVVAEMQERTGRSEEAAKTLRKAIGAHPNAQAPYVALARYHLRRKDPQAALAVAKEAVETNPDQLPLIELLSTTQEAAGADRDALRTLKALVAREPYAVKPLVSLALVQARQRDFDGAAATLLRAQEKAPDNELVKRELIGVYLRAGKPESAMKVAKELQVRLPQDASGYLLEGDVHAYQKKWPDTERAYRAALKVAPHSGAVAVRLYRVLMVAGKKQEAVGFGLDWAARHPGDVPYIMLMAEGASQSRDYATAAQLYETASRNDPNNAVLLNNLAWSLGEMKDPKAIGIAERAVALAPDNASVLDTLGMLHLRLGDPKKGLEILERVRQLAPERPELRLHYAMGLLQTGRTQEGKAELRELAAAKADFPGKAEIPALLAKH